VLARNFYFPVFAISALLNAIVTAQAQADTSAPLPASTSAPTPEAPPIVGASVLSADDITPPYQLALPTFATQLAVAPDVFTKSPTIANSSVSVHGLAATFEYQPQAWQKYGVFDIGAIGGVYIITPQGVVTSSALDLFSIGVQFRYQARFYQEQPIVPFVGYAAEYFHYENINGASQSLNQNGPMAGLMFLLNDLDPTAMRDLYKEDGISRIYLVVEARGTSSGNQTLPWSPSDWYFGIRTEF
jgi:hypothetical protein